jgi:hypothetical protein
MVDSNGVFLAVATRTIVNLLVNKATAAGDPFQLFRGRGCLSGSSQRDTYYDVLEANTGANTVRRGLLTQTMLRSTETGDE